MMQEHEDLTDVDGWKCEFCHFIYEEYDEAQLCLFVLCTLRVQNPPCLNAILYQSTHSVFPFKHQTLWREGSRTGNGLENCVRRVKPSFKSF